VPIVSVTRPGAGMGAAATALLSALQAAPGRKAKRPV
jgi:hypothetical protein